MQDIAYVSQLVPLEKVQLHVSTWFNMFGGCDLVKRKIVGNIMAL